MFYFGLKTTKHHLEVLPRFSINLPKRNRNDVVVISWLIFEIVFGFEN